MLITHGPLLLRHAIQRSLFTTSQLWQNHYDSLGIAKSSTQNEIKAAYYKLSLLYHPDRNQGSEDAAKKFREITQAYEVLGNYRLRRLYDKGVTHTLNGLYGDVPDIEVEADDPETKFYKSRFKKSKVADAEGRTPIYDFDEWSRAHYGKSFDRRQAAKAKSDRINWQKEQNSTSRQSDIVMFSFIFGAIMVYLMFISQSSHDIPKQQQQAAEVKMSDSKTT